MSGEFKICRLYCPRCKIYYVVNDSDRCKLCYQEMSFYERPKAECSK